MKVLTAAAMREADRRVSAELGLPGAVLMENAGLRVTEAVAAINTQRQKVVIVAGPGNNGGDGVVAARLLSQAGFTVSLWSTSRPGQNPGDADNNLKFLSNSGVDWLHILETGELPAFRADLKKAGLVIDALLGTGVSRPVEGLFAAIIQAINEQEAPVLAVDIPSGVGADSGQVMGTAVKARWTVTLAYPKQGLFLYPGAELAGEISIGSIHIPPFLVESAPTGLITAGQVRQWLLPRPQNAHKGSFGRVLLWAGSIGMTGAATLAGKAALRGGAGLVYLAAPPSLRPALEPKLEEVIIKDIPELEPGEIGPGAVEELLQLAGGCQVFAIGPGLDPFPGSDRLLEKILRESPVPLVLDAGALAMLSGNPESLRECGQPVIITPHPGEMARLTRLTTAGVQGSRLELARHRARDWHCTLILKGARTIVATPAGKVYFNPTGSPALATAGAGDLLTGLVAALVAQGMTAEKAARAGVYLHGLAGDLLPARGAMAGDLLGKFARAFQLVEKAELECSPYGPNHRRVRPNLA